MSRKRLYFILYTLFFSISIQAFGQDQYDLPENFNSLKKQEQVKMLSRLCWINREKQTNKALEYGLQGIRIAKAEGFEKELATLYNFVGVIYQDYKYNVPKALTYYDASLPLSLKVRDSVEIAYVYNNLGDAFYAIGNVPLAFEYGRKSLEIFQRLHNARGIAYGYINMGEANRINRKYDLALDYFRKAIALRKTFHDSVGVASATLEVAQTLFLKGEADSAMCYYRQSLARHEHINNKSYMAYSMQGMGDVYLQRKEFDSAFYCFNRALVLCTQRQNPTGQINSQLGIVKVLAHEGKEKQGEAMLNKALTIATETKLTPNILHVYKAKGEFYHQLKNYHKASENYQHYIKSYDSLYSALQFQTLSQIKDRFLMTEKLNDVNQLLKAKQRVELYSVLIILLLIVLSLVLVFRHRTIARLSNELMESNQAKDKIFSIVSHDLVSPFNVLLGLSDLLMEDLENNDLEAAKSKGLLILRTSEETYHFISNLLTWSRSQRKSIKLNKTEFDLTELVENLKIMFANQAKLKEITVKVKTGEEINVTADKNLIQIVLGNLLNNALKFTHPKGIVDLLLEKEGNQVKITVKDNGTGISPDRLALLFKNETIESVPGTNKEKGTGLGLMLCKELVEMHGSEIQVQSTEGKGSEFWFTLPLA
ncbi:MAG: tetratricopeptide repeat-containing sensor histidine kinase [Bacteroidales bacterium]|nr:tetratricopeptide repeat-containing sensor histidine kinase [Bacteroidales bacterium]